MSLAFVDFTDEQNRLLIDPHPIFVWTKQLLHVALCTTKTVRQLILVFTDPTDKESRTSLFAL